MKCSSGNSKHEFPCLDYENPPIREVSLTEIVELADAIWQLVNLSAGEAVKSFLILLKTRTQSQQVQSPRVSVITESLRANYFAP